MSDLFGNDDDANDGEGTRRRERRGSQRGSQSSAATPRRRRSIGSFLVMVLILGGLGAGGWFLVAKPLLEPDPAPTSMTDYPGPGQGEVTVAIPPGSTGSDIALVLKDAGVVATADAFTKAYNANSAAISIQPGSYKLEMQMKASDAVAALLDSSRRADSSITIGEGWRSSQIYQKVADVLGVPLADVEAAAHDYPAFGLDGPPNTNADVIDPMEGWFFPATYSTLPGDTPATVLKQMYDKMISTLDSMGVAPEDRLRVLTVASIAQGEVALDDDFGKVARVIINRQLPGNDHASKIGMDSTISYAMNLSAQDIDHTIDHPYNTRTRVGLPPSPISSPSLPALQGAAAPPEGTWGYFVTIDMCSGETIFADTLDEFRVYQAQYREWNERYVAGGKVCPVPAG